MLSVLSKTFPRISPIRSYRDRVYGMVDVYVLTHYTWRRVFKDSSDGAQAQYIPNNAQACNSRQYGIKLIGSDPQDAYAAWWRQRQAYQARVAPPVRRMVRFELRARCGLVLECVWGYQTCVAVTINDDVRDSVSSPLVLETMMGFYGDAVQTREFLKYKESKHIPSPDELERMGGLAIRKAATQLCIMLDDIEKNRKLEMRIQLQAHSWNKTLRHLDLRGSPLDNSLTLDASTSALNSLPLIPKGATMPKRKRIRGGGDLHYGNIGWWKFKGRWTTVCIDFGWHYVCDDICHYPGAAYTDQFNNCI